MDSPRNDSPGADIGATPVATPVAPFLQGIGHKLLVIVPPQVGGCWNAVE